MQKYSLNLFIEVFSNQNQEYKNGKSPVKICPFYDGIISCAISVFTNVFIEVSFNLGKPILYFYILCFYQLTEYIKMYYFVILFSYLVLW